MRYLNYDEMNGDILGFFDDEVAEHVVSDISDKSIKVTPDINNILRDKGETYIVKLDAIKTFDREQVLSAEQFDLYFIPKIQVGSDEYKHRMHNYLKSKVEEDITNLGEDKAKSLFMKKYMGSTITDEEQTFINNFIIERDKRLAQYELDKQTYGIAE